MSKLLVTAAAWVVLGAASALAGAGDPQPPEITAMSLPAEPPVSIRSDDAAVRLVQAFGTRCASEIGICPIVPAPIGLYCQCGPYPGTVIP